jgi:hypothetical protein
MRSKPRIEVMSGPGATVPVAAALAMVALAAVLAGVVALARPAAGKGAMSATVTGPGIDVPIDLTYSMDRLDTGMWHALSHDRDPAVLDAAPAGDLGPPHTLTWQVISGQDINGEYATTPIRQDLYLDAEGGPVARTAPGQRFRDTATVELWYRVPDETRDALVEAGVPLAGKKPGNGTEAAAAPPARAPGPSGDPAWPVVVAAGVGGGLALTVTGGALAARRNRRPRRAAQVPL